MAARTEEMRRSLVLPIPPQPAHAALVEEPGDGRLGALPLAPALEGPLALVEAGDDVADDAVPRALDVVVGPGRALAVAAGVDGCGDLLALR
jgi:hypothetical protein